MTYRIPSPCLAAPVFGADTGASFADWRRGPRDAIWRVVETLLCWRERVAQRRALAALDDRLLSDIGVTRSEALAEADKPFWRA